MPAQTTPPDQRCPLCQGRWIDGRVAIPIVGSLRFVYRLDTTEVATEVLARMCQNCGHVQLRARDPELIGRAEKASLPSRPSPRWTLRPQRPPGGYRSRYGQGS